MTISPQRREARRQTLVDAACALIRENGDAGFSMAQLAERAGVSPATPYNLVGGKSELLHLVVLKEFEMFSVKLGGLPGDDPLRRLLAAVDLVAEHYGEDPGFYRGLFYALGSAAAEIRNYMVSEGQGLWTGMVSAAITSGQIGARTDAALLTDVFLRVIRITAETWFIENWSIARLALEIGYASRLLLAGMVTESGRGAILEELDRMQSALAREGATVC